MNLRFFVGFAGGEAWLMGAERIDEIWNKIFLHGALANGLFFVFDDNLRIGDLNDFTARNSELGINEALYHGSFDDDLLNHEIIIGDSKTGDTTEIGVFLCLNA